jgi:ATP-dependent RNA helicase HelY
VRHRWAEIDRLAGELNRAEEEAGLPRTRRPDPGFVGLAHAWAAGEDLAEVISDEEISGGDFVRNVKQLIDLIRQLGDHVLAPAAASTARQAADRLFRGVVAASSLLGG